MADIKKKNRIIQAYYMKIEPGALISEESEINKVSQSAVCLIFSSEYPGPGEGQHGHHGQPVQQQGDGLRHDTRAQPGDQQEAAGRSGGHFAEEHHLEGEHQHARPRDQ